MPTIEDLPDKILVRIFEIVCEGSQVTWDDIPSYNEDTPVYKPLARVARTVCKSWRFIIDNSPDSHFYLYYFHLAIGYEPKFGIRDLIRLRNGLAHVEKGAEFLISIRSTSGIYTSELYRLFLHGMSLFKPYQSQIYGLFANLHSDKAYSYFLRLLSSLDLPALTVLDLQQDSTTPLRTPHKNLCTSAVQKFDSVFPKRQISISKQNYPRLQWLRAPNGTWFDNIHLGPRVSELIIIMTVNMYDLSWHWFPTTFGSQGVLCKNLTHLQISAKGAYPKIDLPDGKSKNPTDQMLFPALKILELVADRIPWSWVRSLFEQAVYPNLRKLSIKYLHRWDLQETEFLLVRMAIKRCSPLLHTMDVWGEEVSIFPFALLLVSPLDLKNLTIGLNVYQSLRWELRISRTPGLLLIRAAQCQYEDFLAFVKFQCMDFPPCLEIIPESDFAFYGYPVQDLGDYITIPSLVELKVLGFPTLILEDFLFRLKASNLAQVSIRYGPLNDLRNNPPTMGDGIYLERERRIEKTQFPMVNTVKLQYEENIGRPQVIDILNIFPNIEILQIDVTKDNRWGLKLIMMDRFLSLLRPGSASPRFPLLRVLEIRISWYQVPRAEELTKLVDNFNQLLEEPMNPGCNPLRLIGYEWEEGQGSLPFRQRADMIKLVERCF